MTDQHDLTAQHLLIRSLVTALSKDCADVRVFETHMSWVLVAGAIAYKLKKAVVFDFADFSSLDARRFYCEEELRLNRRLAPRLYLALVRITGGPTSPLIDGPGVPIEYAVKMRAFSQQALWSERIRSHCISTTEIDRLATKVAQFHEDAAVAAGDSDYGTPPALSAVAADTLATIATRVTDPEHVELVRIATSWHHQRQQSLTPLFVQRKVRGMIRECHGDLHGGNILTIDDQVEIFDCIEFNESLRWIDVMNDLAFIGMDLRCHGREDLAARLLNHYIEITGDYDGLAVLTYYQFHRALVRCKVSLLRAQQLRGGDADAAASRAAEASQASKEATSYLAFAAGLTRPGSAAIMVTHGYSGSGKSTFAQLVVEQTGAIRVRSDVERKRLHGVSATTKGDARPAAVLYDSAATERTYHQLLLIAQRAVEAGWPVVVDAAFLRKEQRDLFRNLARDLHVPFFIFAMAATEATMRARITSRQQIGQDASDADLDVLAHQLVAHDELADDEMADVIAVDSALDPDALRQCISPVRASLRTRASR